MSISIKSSKNDTIYTLNSDVLIYLNDFSTNKIELSHIMHKDTSFKDLVTLPFYWELVVDYNSSTAKRNNYIYDLLRRKEYLLNIRNVKWMIGADALHSELLTYSFGIRNLTHLTIGSYFNQPLGDSLQGLSNLIHLESGNVQSSKNRHLGTEFSIQGLTSLV